MIHLLMGFYVIASCFNERFTYWKGKVTEKERQGNLRFLVHSSNGPSFLDSVKVAARSPWVSHVDGRDPYARVSFCCLPLGH